MNKLEKTTMFVKPETDIMLEYFYITYPTALLFSMLNTYNYLNSFPPCPSFWGSICKLCMSIYMNT